MVICLERVADLHMSQLMPLPLTVCCFSKIQIGFTFLVPAYPGSPGKGPLNGCSVVVVSCQKTGIHGEPYDGDGRTLQAEWPSCCPTVSKHQRKHKH